MSDITRTLLTVVAGITTLTCFVMFCALRPHINSTITRLLSCLLITQFISSGKATVLLILLDNDFACQLEGGLSHFSVLFHVILNACLAFESLRISKKQRALQDSVLTSTLSTNGNPSIELKSERRIVYAYISLATFIGSASTLLALFVSPGFGSNESGERRHYCHMTAPSNEVDIPLFFSWIWLSMVVCLCCNVSIVRMLRGLASGEETISQRLRASIARLILYPMIFAVCWLPVLVLHIYTRAVPYRPPYVLSVVCEVLATMTGFCDAVALGLSHQKIRGQLQLIFSCKKRPSLVQVEGNYLLISEADEDPFGANIHIKFFGEVSETF